MTPLIQLHDISKSYPAARSRGSRKEAGVTAVDGVSLTVEPGEIVGLLGQNGAGKTTTIKIACGLIKPDSGTVKVNGYDVARQRGRALQHLSAVLEGNRNLYWRLTVRENLEYFAGNRGWSPRSVRGEIDALLERFELNAKEHELVSSLSRGMQQKLAIGVALFAGSEVVLLDEPTLGLDVETGYEVRALLREVAAEGRTVVLSTHDMPVVQELCQRTVIIDQGRVVTDDSVSNLLALFRSRAYQVSLSSPLEPEQRSAVEESFTTNISADGLSFTVELAQAVDLYRLTDWLRGVGAAVDAISRVTVDFEQVFRRLVNRRDLDGHTVSGQQDGRQNRVGPVPGDLPVSSGGAAEVSDGSD